MPGICFGSCSDRQQFLNNVDGDHKMIKIDEQRFDTSDDENDTEKDVYVR